MLCCWRTSKTVFPLPLMNRRSWQEDCLCPTTYKALFQAALSFFHQYLNRKTFRPVVIKPGFSQLYGNPEPLPITTLLFKLYF